jgi:hypothetical protein
MMDAVMDLGCHLPNDGSLATGEALAAFAREAERDVAEILDVVAATVRPAVERT